MIESLSRLHYLKVSYCSDLVDLEALNKSLLRLCFNAIWKDSFNLLELSSHLENLTIKYCSSVPLSDLRVEYMTYNQADRLSLTLNGKTYTASCLVGMCQILKEHIRTSINTQF